MPASNSGRKRSDFFALLDPDGKLIAVYSRGAPSYRHMVEQELGASLRGQEGAALLALDDRLYEISTQALYFGERAKGTQLGFVAVGYAIDEQVAREVSEAAAAEVTFAVGGQVVASTLNAELQQQLASQAGDLLRSPSENKNIQLGGKDYLAASVIWRLLVSRMPRRLPLISSFSSPSIRRPSC